MISTLHMQILDSYGGYVLVSRVWQNVTGRHFPIVFLAGDKAKRRTNPRNTRECNAKPLEFSRFKIV